MVLNLAAPLRLAQPVRLCLRLLRPGPRASRGAHLHTHAGLPHPAPNLKWPRWTRKGALFLSRFYARARLARTPVPTASARGARGLSEARPASVKRRAFFSYALIVSRPPSAGALDRAPPPLSAPPMAHHVVPRAAQRGVSDSKRARAVRHAVKCGF